MLTTTSLEKNKELTAEDKKRKINEARLYHSTLLQDAGASDTDFTVKLAFFDKGQKIIGVFPTEFKKPNGFFLEFVDSKLDPIDPKRTVYKLTPRDNYEDVYNLLKSGAYAVPVEELEEVKPSIIKELNPEFKIDMNAFEEKKDDHYSKMTISDLAAILWREPVSDKPWLNSLIQSLKDH